MSRRPFAILSALSLLLFVTICVLWARSYSIADDLRARWTKQFNDLSIGLLCDSGAFHISIYRISRTSVDPDIEGGRRLSWSRADFSSAYTMSRRRFFSLSRYSGRGSG